MRLIVNDVFDNLEAGLFQVKVEEVDDFRGVGSAVNEVGSAVVGFGYEPEFL